MGGLSSRKCLSHADFAWSRCPGKPDTRLWISLWVVRMQVAYSRFNLEIYSLRKCYEIEKRSGVYTNVHEHRIAEVKAFAAL